MNQADIAYAAGFVDGEGCISVGIKSGRKNCLVWKITVVNTDFGIIQWFKNTFGGSYYQRKTYKATYAVSWAWAISNINGEEFLKLILPYLKVKKEVANVFLELRETRKYISHRNRKTPDALVEKRDSLILKIRELNKRGPQVVGGQS